MSCRGKVTGGVVVLEEAEALPEGAEVRVEVVRRRTRHAKPVNGWDELLKLAGTVKGLPPDMAHRKRPRKAASLPEKLRAWAGGAKGLPSDMARNHDHYLYGVPKK
ncbi:MAG: hypothetical protein ABSE73_22430 [Planctomycetota bacterium]